MSIPHHITAQYENYPEYKLCETENGIEIEYADAFWPAVHPLDIELGAYRANWQSNAFHHLKKAHHIAWPSLVPTWNDWTEIRYQKFCESWKVTVWAGGANIGKSLDAGCLSLLFWWANPRHRTVLVGSTTIHDLDSRIFGYVKRYDDIPRENGLPIPGYLYTSAPPKIILNKKDTTHGIFTIALLKGQSKSKANNQANNNSRSSNLIGRHPDEGFLAIIDEGPDVSPAFMEAFPNWDKAPLFKCIVIGNSASMYDPHGILATPKDGWSSISPDFDTQWVTKTGICLYFDCYRSPAMTETDPQKRAALSIFLPTEAKIEEDKQTYGENSYSFWRMARGFWPPEDVAQTILSPLTLDKKKAKAKTVWSGNAELTRVASLDPAFTAGGDACVLRFADLGKDVDGRWVIDYGGPEYIHYLKLDARSDQPIDYQIVDQAKSLTREAGIKASNVAVDVNGTGMGLGSIIAQDWSREVFLVESNGGCSELVISNAGAAQGGKIITAKDVYDRKVTELWFMLQKFVLASQIRGLDDKTCEQLCTRQYTWIGRKLSIEKKIDYKQRMGKVDSRYKSPDEADGATLIIELIRHRFGLAPNAAAHVPNDDKLGWQKFFQSKRLLDGVPATEEFSDQRNSRSDNGYNPIDWSDGFRHSQFDREVE